MKLKIIIILFLFFIGVLSLLYRLASIIPFISFHLTEIFGILFLFTPSFLPKQFFPKFEPFNNLKKGIIWGLISSVIILSLYTVIHHSYFFFACRYHLPTLGRNCLHFGFRWTYNSIATFSNIVAINLIAIALPEEFFYRGFLQPLIYESSSLQYLTPTKRMFLAILIQAILFALGHFLVDWNPIRLSVFFPALLFGYITFKTKGIYASILLHGFSNVISDILERGSF